MSRDVSTKKKKQLFSFDPILNLEFCIWFDCFSAYAGKRAKSNMLCINVFFNFFVLFICAVATLTLILAITSALSPVFLDSSE